MLQVGLQTCTPDVWRDSVLHRGAATYVKVVLREWKGKIKVDLKPVFGGFTAGAAFRVNHVALITPAAPAATVSAPIPLQISRTRLNDGTCNDGIGILGVGGIAVQ